MLKKISLLLLVICLVYNVNAQFSKGQRMVGASIGTVFYNSGNSEISFPNSIGYDSKTTTFGVNINPSIGWFVSDKTAVGVSLNINPNSQKTTNESNGNTFQKNKTSQFNLGIGGFARNYFGSGGGFLPFGQFALNLGFTNQNIEGFNFVGNPPTGYKDTYDGKSSGGFFSNATFSLGATKMINSNVGLDVYLGYTFSYAKTDMKTVTSRDLGIDGSIDESITDQRTTKTTTHGAFIGVGFQIFLGSK